MPKPRVDRFENFQSGCNPWLKNPIGSIRVNLDDGFNPIVTRESPNRVRALHGDICSKCLKKFNFSSESLNNHLFDELENWKYIISVNMLLYTNFIYSASTFSSHQFTIKMIKWKGNPYQHSFQLNVECWSHQSMLPSIGVTYNRRPLL